MQRRVQAKPSQSANWGAEICANSTSLCLLDIPYFDSIALGSITDTLTLTGEYAYANNFNVTLKALIYLAKDYCLGGLGLIVGGINFGWLAVWVLILDWLIRKPGGMQLLSGA